MRGLLPRALDYIFSAISQDEESRPEGSVTHLARVSYLEIYNERIFDLLDPTMGGSKGLQLREDLKKGVYVEGLEETPVSSAAEALGHMERGSRNRTVGATAMNHESSRSHSVFTLHLESREQSGGGLVKSRRARFTLIDLAGSERQSRTQAEGERLKEANAINKSLSALGNVISALAVSSKASKSSHVRYRDSKLTFLLRDALGGNSRTALVANISPADDSFGETLSTLQFASRAKLVRNKAVRNEDLEGSVRALQEQVALLKAQLHAAGVSSSGGALPEPAGSAMRVLSREDKFAAARYAAVLAEWEAVLETTASSVSLEGVLQSDPSGGGGVLLRLLKAAAQSQGLGAVSSRPAQTATTRVLLNLLADAAHLMGQKEDDVSTTISTVLATVRPVLTHWDASDQLIQSALWRAQAAERESRCAVAAEQDAKEMVVRLQRANEALKLRLRLARKEEEEQQGEEIQPESDRGQTREELLLEIASLRQQVSACPEAGALQAEVSELQSELEALRAGEGGMWDGDVKTAGADSMRQYVRELEDSLVSARVENALSRTVMQHAGVNRARVETMLRDVTDLDASLPPLDQQSATVLHRWLSEERWKDEKRGMDEELAKARGELLEVRRQASSHGSRADEAEEEAARWRAMHDDAQSRAEALERARCRLEEELQEVSAEAKSDLAEAMDEARKRHRATVEELESSLQHAQREGSEWKNGATKLQKKVDTLGEELASVQGQLGEAKEKHTATLTELEGLREEQSVTARQLTELADGKERLQEALRRETEALDALKASAQKQASRISSLEQDLASARSQLQEQRRRADKAEFEKESLEEDVSGLEEAVALYKNEKRTAAAQAKEAQRRAEEAERRAAEMEGAMKRAETREREAASEGVASSAALHTAYREVEEARGQLNQVTVERERLAGAVEQLERDLEDSRASLKETQARLDDAEQAARDAMEAVAETRLEREQSDAATADALAEAAEALSRAETAEAEVARLEEELQSKVKEANDEVSKALEIAEMRSSDAEGLRAELGALQRELERATGELRERARSEEAAVARAERQASLVASLEATLSTARSDAAQYRREAVERQNQLHEELSKWKNDANHGVVKLHAAEIQLEALRSRIKATEIALPPSGDASVEVADRVKGFLEELQESKSMVESLNADLVANEEALEEAELRVREAEANAREAQVKEHEARSLAKDAVLARDEAERRARDAEARMAKEEVAGEKMEGLVSRLQGMLAAKDEELRAAHSKRGEGDALVFLEEHGRALAKALVEVTRAVLLAREEWDNLSGNNGLKARIGAVNALKRDNAALRARVSELEEGGTSARPATVTSLLSRAEQAEAALRTTVALLKDATGHSMAAVDKSKTPFDVLAAWTSAEEAQMVLSSFEAIQAVLEEGSADVASSRGAAGLAQAVLGGVKSDSAASLSSLGEYSSLESTGMLVRELSSLISSLTSKSSAVSDTVASARPAGAMTPLRQSASARRQRVGAEMLSPLQKQRLQREARMEENSPSLDTPPVVRGRSRLSTPDERGI
jgi:kinesin family member 15